MNKELEYIEFTKNCGDCGRRFKQKYAISPLTKDYFRLVRFYWDIVCCPKCSQKHYEEDLQSKKIKKKK